ncbi:MAG: GFA family protein [Alphaproteobacteria bacterium]|jgi:hypothetical protein|nr:GFA family protein [Alphaproteobacteria bacterium]MBT4017664.1 GFA family protein [Alphaproteobacteria bacterium]MBT4964796.1 GFA family protein [Alphaproteobacteria bacterium]MBT5162122.1 GFA family protein [Alphaproteobacteria bacterium]MBT5919406.1 GFA family protein [Alphaproteobacteria bacterium]
MTKNIELAGSCQCGNAHYQIHSPSVVSVACHCNDCRKQSGSAFAVSLVVKSTDVTFSNNLKTWERMTDTGRRNRAWFCPDCGNRIYHQDPDAPTVVRIRAGTLDNEQIPEPMVHVFTARKVPWLTFPDHVTLFEGQPEVDQLYAALEEAAASSTKEES